MNNSAYILNVQRRSVLRFLKGVIPRALSTFLNELNIALAKRKGAVVGKSVSLPYKLAKIANSNLVIGNHVSIQSSKIDLRSRVEICSYAIIGAEVEILTASHNVDSVDWEMKCYGITIGEYAWLATRTLILPSCQTIGRGAVCAAGSVVCSDVEPMAIVSGNPAKKIRNRNKIHSELCVESLLGNDFEKYVMTYIDKTKARK